MRPAGDLPPVHAGPSLARPLPSISVMRPSLAIVALAICSTVGCDRKPDTLGSPAEVAKEAPVTSKTSPELVHQQSSLVSADSGTVSDFDQRVKDFIQLRDTIDRDLTKLPDKATPIQIDKHQRELGDIAG